MVQTAAWRHPVPLPPQENEYPLISACSPLLSLGIAKRWRTLPGASQGYDYSDVSFSQLDLSDPISLENAIRGCDLVVHTAGPFQRKNSAEVLEAAIQAKASNMRSMMYPEFV